MQPRPPCCFQLNETIYNNHFLPSAICGFVIRKPFCFWLSQIFFSSRSSRFVAEQQQDSGWKLVCCMPKMTSQWLRNSWNEQSASVFKLFQKRTKDRSNHRIILIPKRIPFKLLRSLQTLTYTARGFSRGCRVSVGSNARQWRHRLTQMKRTTCERKRGLWHGCTD